MSKGWPQSQQKPLKTLNFLNEIFLQNNSKQKSELMKNDFMIIRMTSFKTYQPYLLLINLLKIITQSKIIFSCLYPNPGSSRNFHSSGTPWHSSNLMIIKSPNLAHIFLIFTFDFFIIFTQCSTLFFLAIACFTLATLPYPLTLRWAKKITVIMFLFQGGTFRKGQQISNP